MDAAEYAAVKSRRQLTQHHILKRRNKKKAAKALQAAAGKFHRRKARFPKGWFEVRDSASYAKYLESAWWRRRRGRAIKQAGNCCKRCKSPNRLQVHHRNYKRLWGEADADLEVLCHDCHQVEHRAQNLKVSVDEVYELDTAEMIRGIL